MALVRPSDDEFGIVTMSFTPSNDRAFPRRPATRLAPEIVPVLPVPEASFAVVPDVSSNDQAPTRPQIGGSGGRPMQLLGGGVGVGVGVGDGVGVGVGDGVGVGVGVLHALVLVVPVAS